MTDLRDLVVRWQRGWSASRALPAASDVGGALRIHCMQRGRDIEYFALDPGPAAIAGLAALVAAEDAVTWLTVPTTDPAGAAAALTAAGLIVLRGSELLMTADLRAHPRPEPAAPYRLRTEVDSHRGSAAVTATALHESGEVGARGSMGLAGADAVADRIETLPAHRRRGLASAVMGALAACALEAGAGHGLLIASEDGQRLYATLGWRPAAAVLIATTPGNTFPS